MAIQARVFLVGATGFVGGDILYQVIKSFPSSRVFALVRDVEKSKGLIATYPQIELLQGTLDSAEIIEEEVALADVVISAANFHHHGLADSISRGVLKSTTPRPTTWLQISGSSIVSVPDIIKGSFGEHSDDKYDDYEGVDAIRTFIQNTPSRYVDRLVQNFSAEHADKVKAALIFPPIIYGISRSLGNTRSVQIPDLCKHAITKHEALYIGKGEARWGHTHVADVSQLVVKLMEASLDGRGPQEELWNKNGLYFTATGEMTWKTMAAQISALAKGKGIEAPLKSLTAEEADEWAPHASVLWGTNARGFPSRGAKFLNYAATKISGEKGVEEAFDIELAAYKKECA